jgi:hypothetical protein
MHRFENGMRIELTKEEILEQERKWEEATAHIESKRAAALEEKKKEVEILIGSGLTKAAIECLRPDLKELINIEV